jgi:class 3 adenylate cyclase/pimeloyl-ACP methyl ester carboxylesterase
MDFGPGPVLNSDRNERSAHLKRRLAAILAADVAGYSRMMAEDEGATLRTLQTYRSLSIDPAIARHSGRIVKLMGDGLLAEFSSAVEAVDCAAEVQRDLAARNAEAVAHPMVFRMGVHVGDIIVEGDDLFGDGVNVASRLEGIAQPGGICLSRQAYDQVRNKLSLDFHSLGPQRLKNIPDPVEAFSVQGDGLAATGERQEIRYCRAPDNVRLAYAISGNGPPLVKSANWMNHLQYDWESPVWHHFLTELSRDHQLYRYDARGNGLSDWDVAKLSLDTWVTDLETVVDHAGLDRFPLLGYSQGCAISIAYAVRHPERVSHLILYGGFPRSRPHKGPEGRERIMALATLARTEWGSDSPAFRQMFALQLLPDAGRAQIDALNELARRSISGNSAAKYFEAIADLDVVDILGEVRAPTLVLHVRGDVFVPFMAGQAMAERIPGARFVALEGRNHALLGGDPATDRFFEELRLFLKS